MSANRSAEIRHELALIAIGALAVSDIACCR
ncbi:Ms4533A family Cys-rich leader peptide [Skermania sp. ID1734]